MRFFICFCHHHPLFLLFFGPSSYFPSIPLFQSFYNVLFLCLLFFNSDFLPPFIHSFLSPFFLHFLPHFHSSFSRFSILISSVLVPSFLSLSLPSHFSSSIPFFLFFRFYFPRFQSYNFLSFHLTSLLLFLPPYFSLLLSFITCLPICCPNTFSPFPFSFSPVSPYFLLSSYICLLPSPYPSSSISLFFPSLSLHLPFPRFCHFLFLHFLFLSLFPSLMFLFISSIHIFASFHPVIPLHPSPFSFLPIFLYLPFSTRVCPLSTLKTFTPNP